MILLKVFVSSVQKELRAERIVIGSLPATDDFGRDRYLSCVFQAHIRRISGVFQTERFIAVPSETQNHSANALEGLLK
jgi:hypothetical protein